MNKKTSGPAELNTIDNLVLSELKLGKLSQLIGKSLNAFLPSRAHPEETTETLLQKFRFDPNFALYGYEIDGQPVSYIVALSHKGKESIAIGPMYVAEALRGRGLGKKQIIDLIELYKLRGCSVFFTKTWSSNQVSTSTFDQLGFRVVGTEENDRVNGDATISFQLNTL
ncbi:GNAT family N-acetyltransferase [Candidatus Saccharibacteria bacterium]|nr:GNAT family N-acetyltransferase [Candidatus Saccharibacteria bacterium]